MSRGMAGAGWMGAGWMFAGLFLFAPPARAVTVFTDQAAFLAALAPGYSLETFEGLEQFPAAPIAFSNRGFTYSAELSAGTFFNFTNPDDASDQWLSTISRRHRSSSASRAGT